MSNILSDSIRPPSTVVQFLRALDFSINAREYVDYPSACNRVYERLHSSSSRYSPCSRVSSDVHRKVEAKGSQESGCISLFGTSFYYGTRTILSLSSTNN